MAASHGQLNGPEGNVLAETVIGLFKTEVIRGVVPGAASVLVKILSGRLLLQAVLHALRRVADLIGPFAHAVSHILSMAFGLVRLAFGLHPGVPGRPAHGIFN
jgi:hypothetical protein